MCFITTDRNRRNRCFGPYGSSSHLVHRHTSPDKLQKFRVSIVDGNVLGQATNLIPDVIMKHPDYSKKRELKYFFCFHVSFLQECYRQFSYRFAIFRYQYNTHDFLTLKFRIYRKWGVQNYTWASNFWFYIFSRILTVWNHFFPNSTIKNEYQNQFGRIIINNLSRKLRLNVFFSAGKPIWLILFTSNWRIKIRPAYITIPIAKIWLAMNLNSNHIFHLH